MYVQHSYWTTARTFTLDPTIAHKSQLVWKPMQVPEYTYKKSTVGHKRIRPRCEDLQVIVKTTNVTHGRID